MSKKKQKAQLLLPTHDAHLFSAGYSPEYQRQSRLVFLLSELWDEERQQHTCAHMEFRQVAAFEACLNVFDDPMGADVVGLYELFGKKKKIALLERCFQRRRDMWLLPGNYDYDPEDPWDVLNSREELEHFERKKNLKKYRLFLLEKQGGGFLILARDYQVREIPADVE